MNINCTCGSNKLKEQCCLPIIEGRIDAETAEQLMRSRYTAFTLFNADYLMKSHHTQTRNIKEKKEIKRWAKSVKWVGLTIIKTKNGLANNNKGSVEFKAVYIENGELKHIHENSFFEREKGRWVYVSETNLT